MNIIEISPNWWILTSWGDGGRWVLFGYTRGEVIGKFNQKARQVILERAR